MDRQHQSPNEAIGNGNPELVHAVNTPRSTGRRKQARLRLACLRCQRRKIRCDGAIPSCSACGKVGAACVDGDHQRQRDFPRAYITSLKSRISWLESQLRAHCPEVDISAAPEVHDDVHENADLFPESSETSVIQLLPHSAQPHEVQDNIIQQNSPPSTIQDEADVQRPASGYQRPGGGLAHEIGLVSLSNGNDPKYIGPSSGYFFTKLMVASLGQQGARDCISGSTNGAESYTSCLGLANQLLQNTETKLPATKEQALQISAAFFDIVHVQYPFLHRPTHEALIDRVYTSESPEPMALFQINMVLAISSIILSRQLKVSFPGEGYCANAMQHFEHLGIETSIKGLQCLLLLVVYIMYSPSMKLNAWYLNYQCIAAVLDLGLQRDIRPRSKLSVLEIEMRTRIFWVVYSLDRTLATMMGRPIGLRDEACDLRLPADIDDVSLLSPNPVPRDSTSPPTHITYSIHLFRLSQLNSEIKYVLHSITRDPVPYATPNIPDHLAWQQSMLSRLQAWTKNIPPTTTTTTTTTNNNNLPSSPSFSPLPLLLTKSHTLIQLLLRPSPALPSPSSPSVLKTCHASAVQTIRLFASLYRANQLVFTSTTFHNLILSAVTMFYCIWNVPSLAGEAGDAGASASASTGVAAAAAAAAETRLDGVMADVRAAGRMLAAAGEHWAGAKRSGDFLEELGQAVVRKVVGGGGGGGGGGGVGNRRLRLEGEDGSGAGSASASASATTTTYSSFMGNSAAGMATQQGGFQADHGQMPLMMSGEETVGDYRPGGIGSARNCTFQQQQQQGSNEGEINMSGWDAFTSLFEGGGIPENTVDSFMQSIFHESYPLPMDEEARRSGGFDFGL